MEWEINPEEYRYILGDFIRSGINIKYEKIEITGNPQIMNIGGKDVTFYPEHKIIYIPYITGRQFHVYKEFHFVSSEDDSYNYCILGENEAGDITDWDIECFKDWQYFCEAFGITNTDDKSIFKNETNYCYAFIYDYNAIFLDIPTDSYDVSNNELNEDVIDFLEEQGISKDKYENTFNESLENIVVENIQRKHIFEIYNNYIKQKPYYPINVSLEWFYLYRREKLSIDVILNSITPTNTIYQDDLITNYVKEAFPTMSEEAIITVFKSIRDRYAHKCKTRRNEWYIHTAILMNKILKIEGTEHIAKKIRKVRAFCNNQGTDLSETSSNNVPYLKNILGKYKKNAERIYQVLVANDYINEQTTLSDFKYYLTGELETDIQGKIYWRKHTYDLVDFLLCISGNSGEWKTTSQIFIDKEGKAPTPETLKSTKSQNFDVLTDKFEKMLK